MIGAYCHMFEMRALALRFANVVGPNQTHGVAYDFIRRLRGDPTVLDIMGDGTQSKSYVHVDDVVEALVCLLPTGGDRDRGLQRGDRGLPDRARDRRHGGRAARGVETWSTASARARAAGRATCPSCASTAAGRGPAGGPTARTSPTGDGGVDRRDGAPGRGGGSRGRPVGLVERIPTSRSLRRSNAESALAEVVRLGQAPLAARANRSERADGAPDGAQPARGAARHPCAGPGGPQLDGPQVRTELRR